MTSTGTSIGAPPAANRASKGRRILAFVAGAIWLVLTVPALGLAAMSVMASDGGVNAAIYTFIYACFALPLATLLAAVGGFVSGATGRMWFVTIGSILPFVALAVAFGAIAFGADAPTRSA